MVYILLPSLPAGEYATSLTVEDKKYPEQDFWFATIACSTPKLDAKLENIGIAKYRLKRFINDLKRLQHTGRAKFEIETRDREKFILHIRSLEGRYRFYVDVILAQKSNFVHLKYEIDSTMLLSNIPNA